MSTNLTPTPQNGTHHPKDPAELQRIKRARFTRRAFLLKDFSETDPMVEGETEGHLECFFCAADGTQKKPQDIAHSENCLFRRACRETRQLSNFFKYYEARRNGRKNPKDAPPVEADEA